MIRYVVKRIFMSLIVILVTAILIFLMMNILPGDPAEKMLGDDATYEEILEKREQLGLNGPLLVRLGQYLYKFFLKGDFGTSWTYNTPVYQEVAERLPRTLFISFAHLIISSCLSVPIGILAATHRGKWQDKGILGLAMLAMSIPGFWLSLEMIVLFSVTLHWLPAYGIGSWQCYVLPILSGVFGGWPNSARTTRTQLLEVMRNDYITTARAKGISERRVIVHHMLPNAMLPFITGLGGQVAMMIGGSLTTERTFSIPGVGTYLLTGINNRDYPVVEAVVILLAAVNALAMLGVDLAYGFIDPRIKAQYVTSTNKGRRSRKHA